MAHGKPKFIAGAVCPRCRAVDRMVLDAGAGAGAGAGEEPAVRRCVACGFSEVRPSGPGVMPATRLEGRGKSSAPVSKVRIVDD